LAYLPALNNPFLADDYAFLSLSARLQADWSALGDFPLGGRRLLAHLFFFLCYSLFGLNPAPYYAANLLLHLANAGLVYLLARELTGERRVGLVAALFFVAYERHQEPLFWIATHHELLLSLGVLATAFFFVRFRRTGRWGYYGLALATFGVAGFSKESFVVLAPLLVLLDGALAGWRARRGWVVHVPFWLVSGAYLLLLRVGPWAREFYRVDYAITPHFFEVYLLSLHRLLLLVWPFLLLAGLAYRWAPGRGRFREVLGERAGLVFLGWLLITMVPYSFVLYVDYLSSRHTYLPSVGTAGLVGLLFLRGWERAGRRSWRVAAGVVLGVCLAGNVVHLWRKDADYLARAAPTEELIAVLNREAANLSGSRRVILYDFPYPQVIARGAAQFFTPVAPKRVLVRRTGDGKRVPRGSYRLRWNPRTKTLEPPSPSP
ncbi:MAG: ArnT family glycosyltransferase, partial [Terriglobia bacterium]